MKFLFRSKKNKAPTSLSAPPPISPADTTASNPNYNNTSNAAVGQARSTTTVVSTCSSAATAKGRKGKQKQQKRRESLKKMEVPIAPRVRVSRTSFRTPSTVDIHGPTSRSTPKRRSTKSMNSRVTNVSTSTLSTLSTVRSRNSSIMTHRNSIATTVDNSHRSLDLSTCTEQDQDTQDTGQTPHSPLHYTDALTVGTAISGISSSIQDFSETSSSQQQLLQPTVETHPLKELPFQLVANPHKELGMIHSNSFATVKEVTTHFLLSPQKKLKPILQIAVELPGNTYIGKTVFGHPLIVEAIETHFIVVASTLDTELPQHHCPTTNNPQTTTVMPPSTTTTTLPTHVVTGTSKMSGNYVYTRVRILDPLTGRDLVPCLDRQLSKASLLQAMLDALAMVCPDQPIPRYLTDLLEQEQATIYAAAIRHRRQDLNYHQYGSVFYQQHHHHIPNLNPIHTDDHQAAPMAVFGLEHTALGEILFAELQGVLATQAGWVLTEMATTSIADSTTVTTARQAVIMVSYDPHKLSYCTLAKFAVQQHAQNRLGKPSGLTLYYTSHEEQVAAQMHTRAHYRQLMDRLSNNPAQHYYATTNATVSPVHETIRILALQRDDDDEAMQTSMRSSASSTDSSSDESFTGLNNSLNKTHPGYKVPDYDCVVEHAAAKAAAEAAAAKDKAPRYTYVLKTMSSECLQLQYSKPALRESHLRFVPLTRYQATKANQLVYLGKFHLAMKLLSPRQGMVLMHALRSGKPKKNFVVTGKDGVQTMAAKHEPDAKKVPSNSAASRPSKTRSGSIKSTEGAQASSKVAPTKSPPKLRRVATSDGLNPARPSFPKQRPRMSLNPQQLKQSANALSDSSRPSPLLRTIDTRRGGSPPLPISLTRADIVYEDVVDVPMLEAWRAFVVYPEGVGPDSDEEEDDDDSGCGVDYYTSDDALSL